MKWVKDYTFPVDTRQQNTRRQLGFSLIELMVIIAILGIMSTIAIPNIISYRNNARLRGAASEMLSVFRKAQVAAVKRNYNTGMVFDASTGTTTVFLDNGAGALANNFTQDAGEPTLDVYTVPADCSISGITFASNTTGFVPRGLPLKIGTIVISSASAKAQYRVRVSLAGHTKLEVSTDDGSTWL